MDYGSRDCSCRQENRLLHTTILVVILVLCNPLTAIAGGGLSPRAQKHLYQAPVPPVETNGLAGIVVEAEDEYKDICYRPPVVEATPEKVQALVYSASCYTARWVDSWFGDENDFEEGNISGLVQMGLAYSQFDKFDPSMRLRLRTELPNLSGKMSAFLGRVEEDAYIRDTRADDETAFRNGISEDEQNWLFGLGYNPNPGNRTGWDMSFGIRLRVPPDPYTKLRYRYNKSYKRVDLRYRQTFFWRLDEGFGTTTNMDFAWDAGPNDLIRWQNIATVSEDTEGMDWYTGVTWYEHRGKRRGFAILTFARGETDNEVPLQEYGIYLTWRQPIARDWLYIEYGPSFTWPRELLSQERELSLGFGALVEMEFGDFKRW